MNRNEIFRCLKCIGEATIDNLPDIVEPFSKYSKSLATIIKSIKEGITTYHKLSQDLIKEFETEIRTEGDKIKPPTFMDCVIFNCAVGKKLSENQKNDLYAILERSFENGDEESLEYIVYFIGKYMGGDISLDAEEECEIGDTYISFNFFGADAIDEHPYNETDLRRFMEVLNTLLGEKIFNYFFTGGHEESWSE